MESTLFGGAVIGGSLLAFWNQIKVYFSKFYGLFVVRIVFNRNEICYSNAMRNFFEKNLKQSKFSLNSLITLCVENRYMRILNRYRTIFLHDLPNEPIIYWKNFKPIIFSHDQKENNLKISFIRWTFDEKKMLKDLEESINSQKKNFNRFRIRKFSGSLSSPHGSENHKEQPLLAAKSCDGGSNQEPVNWERDEIGQPNPKSPMDSLALNSTCLEAVEEAKRWIESEKWFKDHLIPHKRGWLLYGKPGTGKTSFVRALAQEMDVPIFVYDLSTMSNNDFLNRWETALEDTPCIVLFEDIDSVFDGRRNLSKNTGAMTFDCLLNCIDGIENTDGIFAVVTTNHIEKIDPAIGVPNGDGISTRPGRIDRAIEMKNPDEDGRRKIAKRILEHYDGIENVIQQGTHDTGAQFQERCARLALKLFWEK